MSAARILITPEKRPKDGARAKGSCPIGFKGGVGTGSDSKKLPKEDLIICPIGGKGGSRNRQQLKEIP